MITVTLGRCRVQLGQFLQRQTPRKQQLSNTKKSNKTQKTRFFFSWSFYLDFLLELLNKPEFAPDEEK